MATPERVNSDNAAASRQNQSEWESPRGPVKDTQQDGFGFMDSSAWMNGFSNFGGQNEHDQESDNLLLRDFVRTINTHTVVDGDTPIGIANTYGIELSELMFENGFSIADPSNGLLWDGSKKFFLQPGMQIALPVSQTESTLGKSDEQLQQEEGLDAALQEAANAKTDEPLKDFFAALLGFTSKSLGKIANSKLSVSFKVEIPVGVSGVYIALGGEFEQVRKESDSTLIEHSIKPKLGVGMKIGPVEGEANVFGFLAVTSADLGQAVDLVSYGMYKLCREQVDQLNDWGPAISTGGTSAALSLVLFYGLNFLYSNNDDLIEDLNMLENNKLEGVMERIKNPTLAENNIAEKEAKLFGIHGEGPGAYFDPSNTNEVSYGMGVEAEVKSGDLSAAASLTNTNTINSQTLQDTGHYGAQDAGYGDRYEVGKLREQELSLEVGYEFGDNSMAGKISYTIAEYVEKGAKAAELQNNSQKQKLWGFKSLAFEVSGSVDIPVETLTTTELKTLEFLVSEGILAFNRAKNTLNRSNPNQALGEIDGRESAAILKRGIGEGLVLDSGLLEAGGLDTSNSTEISFSIACEKDPWEELRSLAVSSQLVIGTQTEVKLDVPGVEFTYTDFDALINYPT